MNNTDTRTKEQIDRQATRQLKFNGYLGGRTIHNVDAAGINMITIEFTDGGKIELEAETAIHTNAGDIPGIFVRVPGEKESY